MNNEPQKPERESVLGSKAAEELFTAEERREAALRRAVNDCTSWLDDIKNFRPRNRDTTK